MREQVCPQIQTEIDGGHSVCLYITHEGGHIVEFIVSLHVVIGGGSNTGPVCFPYITLCK